MEDRIAPGGPDVSMTIHLIMKFLGYAVLGLIAEALEEPGSWYYESPEVGAFLSADHRLAVSLRNGD